jgi:hypothetical protein
VEEGPSLVVGEPGGRRELERRQVVASERKVRDPFTRVMVPRSEAVSQIERSRRLAAELRTQGPSGRRAASSWVRRAEAWHGALKEADSPDVQDLVDVLQELIEWDAHTGGWEAPCWNRARALVAQARMAKIPAGEPRPPRVIYIEVEGREVTDAVLPEGLEDVEIKIADFDGDPARGAR